MAINQNDAASTSTSLDISDNCTLPPWSNLDQDLLFTIMMELGPVDFYAFSEVCKSWSSLALTHKNKFMCSRQPMSASFSTLPCYIEEFDGIIKTAVPHSTGRTCVGVTCGYMIFFGKNTRDFWLVNPITKHELHFPNLPCELEVTLDPSVFLGFLVFSPSVSRWQFMFSHELSCNVSFSLSGNQAAWSDLTFELSILGMRGCDGRVYAVTDDCCLFEVRLDPTPTLILLGK